MRYLISGLLLAAVACDSSRQSAPAPVRTESDQQVKKLREDNEIEFQDLRGRWLAAKGELLRLRTELGDLQAQHTEHAATAADRLDRLESMLVTLTNDVEVMRRDLVQPPPRDDELDRLARSYEEIHCLRKQGAEEAVAEVYRRYGFENLEGWAEAWSRASRSEDFERTVSARVERLCP